MTIHLSIVLFLPLATGLVGAFLPRGLARWAVLAGTVAVLAYVVVMLVDFESGGGLQWVTDDEWISELGIRYSLGVDGLNLFMVALTAIAWVPCTLVAAFSGTDRPRLFFFNLALAETAVLGAFMAQDLALFIVFFDLMLVPFYFLIGGWGAGDRVRATTKFVIYTLSGSLLMMAAAIALGVLATPDGGELSFALADLKERSIPEGSQHWIVLLFALAFFVKAPLFPLHGWVPDTYRATSIPVLALLSGVLSKVGVYGFLRIVLPVMPDGSEYWQELHHHPRGLLDPVRVDPGLLAGQHPARPGLLVDRPARVHRAGDLRVRGEGRPGRALPDAEPRARDRAAVPDRRSDRAARSRERVARRSSAAWHSGRRCWRACSSSPPSRRSPCPARATSSARS